MKVTYLQQPPYLGLHSGEIIPLRDMPDDVLFHYVNSDGSIDYSYINFYDKLGLWDHKDSVGFRCTRHTHRRLSDRNGWRAPGDNSLGYVI